MVLVLGPTSHTQFEVRPTMCLSSPPLSPPLSPPYMPHYAPTAGRATWGQGSHTALARIRVAHRAFLGHIAQATTVVGRAKLGIVAALVELTTNVLTVRARAAAPCRPHCVGPAAGLLPCGMAMLRLPSLIALGLAAPWWSGMRRAG